MKLINLSKRSIIALHACLCLARSDKEYSTRAQLSKLLCVSQAHLTAVLSFLVNADIVRTHRGPYGGISLSRPAQDITLKEIYIAAEGQIALQSCLLDSAKCTVGGCMFGAFLEQTNAQFEKILSQTLANAAKPIKKNAKKRIKKTA